jgi:phosphate:Na+ symporter
VFTLAGTVAGGLGLFLLAMAMMTDGLKLAGGHSIRRILRQWTSTPWRGALIGALVTGVVQSSSAVTVATIGFVNAGLMSLRQALAVVFGANLGTTMTGWLVSLVGFDFRIETYALPIIAIGVAMHLGASAPRRRGLGAALAGLGLFLLGLSVLKDALAGLGGMIGPDALALGGVLGVLSFLIGGMLVTAVTQSSSAALAIFITAAAEGVIPLDAAASAIIGANLGTTSTAVLAALKATTSAKRVALGHIAFNLVTACVALAVLPWLLAGIVWVAGDAGVAPQLALFHTIFNLLGLALLLPFAGRLAGLLERMFRSAEEDLARPRHLDPTAAGAPDLAIAALWLELARLRDITGQVCLAALRPNEPHGTPPAAAAVVPLADAIAAFVTTMRTESMTREVSDELPRVLRTARYLEEAARRSTEADAARRNVAASRPAAVRALAGAVVREAARSIAPSPSEDSDVGRLEAFQRTYQAGKSGLLASAASRQMSVEEIDEMLDALSGIRRMVEQIAKADRELGHAQASAGPGGPTFGQANN